MERADGKKGFFDKKVGIQFEAKLNIFRALGGGWN
jgi:hypothetical protein